MFKICAFIIVVSVSSAAFANPGQEETFTTECSVQAANIKTLKKLARVADFEAFGVFETTYRTEGGLLMKLNEGMESEKLLLYATGPSARMLSSIAFAAKKGMNLIAFNDFCVGAVGSQKIITSLEKTAGKTAQSAESYVTLQFAKEFAE